jgi:hypothetical protein
VLRRSSIGVAPAGLSIGVLAPQNTVRGEDADIDPRRPSLLVQSGSLPWVQLTMRIGNVFSKITRASVDL